MPVSKSKGVQCLSESKVARLIHAISIVNETSSSVTVPPTKQEPCSDSPWSGPKPEAISTSSRLLVGQRVRKIGQKLRRRTFASAGRCSRSGRGADEISWVSAFAPQVLNQLGEAGCVNPVSLSQIASGTSESALPSKCFPFHWHGSSALRPETSAPHWVQRTGFSQNFVASAQKVIFQAWILREFGVGGRKHGVLLLPAPNSGGKVAHASTDAFMCAWVRRRHDELNCSMVFKSLAFSAIVYCSVQENNTSSTSNDEGDRCEKWDVGAARTTPLCLWSIREKGYKRC